VPPYMDRYGPDFATTLQERFDGAMVNRTMQELFLRAFDHASQCYRRYRMQDSGSRRDAEVITAADEHGLAMVFTFERHFRH